MRRYRARINPSGYIFILITMVLSVGAVNTGNNLLYLIASLLLALMLISGLTSLGNLLFLDISLIPPKEVFAGIPARFTLALRRRRGHSLFLRVDTAFGAARLAFVKGESEIPFWLTFPKRGLNRVDGLRVHSGFPMGFFWRARTFPVDVEVPVHPRPVPGLVPSPGGRFQGSAQSGSLRGEPGDEMRELRDYRSSDPLKWVDWKATARKGETVVRDFYRLQGDTLMIDLSRDRGDWERALSKACYLILEGERRRLSVALRLPDREIGPGRGEAHKKTLLEAITLA
jgi:uncharacterized protein (DUF58 family)